jgi:hypothetical protein
VKEMLALIALNLPVANVREVRVVHPETVHHEENAERVMDLSHEVIAVKVMDLLREENVVKAMGLSREVNAVKVMGLNREENVAKVMGLNREVNVVKATVPLREVRAKAVAKRVPTVHVKVCPTSFPGFVSNVLVKANGAISNHPRYTNEKGNAHHVPNPSQKKKLQTRKNNNSRASEIC